MSSSHLDRKELKRPDAFLERTNSAFQFVGDNSKAFLAGLALIFLLALGVTLINNFSEKKNEAADSALFTAKKTLVEGLQKTKAPTPPSVSADKTKTSPGPVATLSWDEATRPGLTELEKVAVTHSGTRGAFEAELTIGDTWYDHGDWAKAAEHYKKAVEMAKPRAARPIAQHALAYAYENSKQYDLAVDSLRQVLASGDVALKRDSMLSLARNLELKGDKPKALEQYNLVIQEFPNSQAAKTAEVQVSHLK